MVSLRVLYVTRPFDWSCTFHPLMLNAGLLVNMRLWFRGSCGTTYPVVCVYSRYGQYICECKYSWCDERVAKPPVPACAFPGLLLEPASQVHCQVRGQPSLPWRSCECQTFVKLVSQYLETHLAVG